MRAAPAARATRPCASSSSAPAALRVRDPLDARPARPRHRRGPGRRACAPPRRSSRRSGTARCGLSTPAGSPAGSAWRSSRSCGRSARRVAPLARSRNGGGRGSGRRARAAARRARGSRGGACAAGGPGGRARRGRRPGGLSGGDPRDPVARVEREALECLLQVPQLVPLEEADGLGDSAFEVPAYRSVHLAIKAAGGIAKAPHDVGHGVDGGRARGGPRAGRAVGDATGGDAAARGLRRGAGPVRGLRGAAAGRGRGVAAGGRAAEPGTAAGRRRSGAGQAFAELLAVEAQRRTLRERISGGG